MANTLTIAPTLGPEIEPKAGDRRLSDVEGDTKKDDDVYQTQSPRIGFRLSDL
jgi:hypothetical protein